MANFSVCVGRRLENPRGKLNSSIQWNWWDYSACKHAGNAREGGLPSLPSASVDSTAPSQLRVAWAHSHTAFRNRCNYWACGVLPSSSVDSFPRWESFHFRKRTFCKSVPTKLQSLQCRLQPYTAIRCRSFTEPASDPGVRLCLSPRISYST